MILVKTCERCGNQFARRSRVTYAQWARTRYCSSICYQGRQVAVARVIAGCSRFHSNGYRMLFCPFHPSAVKGYVYEHRIVVERRLGRLLEPHEYVHHRNEIKTDNRDANLELVRQSDHAIHHRGTPTDGDVAELIRNGLTSRQIAALGVGTHRIVRVRRAIA